jgi:hypothetical protein
MPERLFCEQWCLMSVWRVETQNYYQLPHLIARFSVVVGNLEAEQWALYILNNPRPYTYTRVEHRETTAETPWYWKSQPGSCWGNYADVEKLQDFSTLPPSEVLEAQVKYNQKQLLLKVNYKGQHES